MAKIKRSSPIINEKSVGDSGSSLDKCTNEDSSISKPKMRGKSAKKEKKRKDKDKGVIFDDIL